MQNDPSLGFVGLGVMGEPMCANLVRKSNRTVHVFDLSAEPLERLQQLGAVPAVSIEALGAQAHTVFLSLPSIQQVEEVCERLLIVPKKPARIVDMSTSDVARTRVLAKKLAAVGIDFTDAPVARMREAAKQGTLLITVGGSDASFIEVQPLLACMGSDVVHAGDVGNGQVVKILNNLIVFTTVNLLAEVLTIGRRAGIDGERLFSALSLGSGDSFVLRNPGMKSLVADSFPEKTFPTDYAIKDINLALTLAKQGGFEPVIALHTHDLLCQTREAGFALNYYPALITLLDGRTPIPTQKKKA